MADAPRIIEHPSDHRSSRAGAAPICIVVHATAGTNSLDWLTHNPRGVSIHILAPKSGTILYRMVPDALAAHHVGFSRIVLDGVVYMAETDPDPNQISLGIELENRNTGHDPYPDTQLAAAGWQIGQWHQTHGLLPILFHRDIDLHGKTDPAGLTMARLLSFVPPILPPTPPFTAYTADSLLVGSPHATPGQATSAILARSHSNYNDRDITDVIVPTYYEVCRSVGVDAVLAIAQMIHETGNLTSFWSARGLPTDDNKRRNPAGIGVTGAHQRPRPSNTERWAYNPVKRWWEAGCGFATWKDHAIPVHVGRLLAYALPADTGTPVQRVLIERALAVRALPPICRGSAPILRQLGKGQNPHGNVGCGWAGKDTTEGLLYGANIAHIANGICEEAV